MKRVVKLQERMARCRHANSRSDPPQYTFHVKNDYGDSANETVTVLGSILTTGALNNEFLTYLLASYLGEYVKPPFPDVIITSLTKVNKSVATVNKSVTTVERR
ncbi:hypothetical protein EVAR_46881_1 [Eumeta japonica]|uniref:Uncharacterized protein n=1 Tax=Eumeta variegata TaxID=151549 RepID=A0A4C1YBN7_EUMVA|nr:hypothetical protein EVAR_46881_1 [Eumeta japonica]